MSSSSSFTANETDAKTRGDDVARGREVREKSRGEETGGGVGGGEGGGVEETGRRRGAGDRVRALIIKMTSL